MLAVVHAINDKLNYSTRRKLQEHIGDIDTSTGVTEFGLNVALRIFLLDVLVSAYGSHQVKGSKNAFAFQVIKKYLPKEIAQIEIGQQEKAEKRQSNVRKRIEALRKQADKTKAIDEPIEDPEPDQTGSEKNKSKRKAKTV
jgi:hypothetical protein